MRLTTVTKILLCISLIALTACVQKTDKFQLTAKTWHWDDQKKHWFNENSVFEMERHNFSKVSWKGQKQAISLHIESGKSLNSFDNAPNALLMKVFQLNNPRDFLKAAESSSGLRRLLTAEQIDSAYIAKERLLILPGKVQKLTLDRVDGARYVGIVLGYSNLEQAQIFRLIPIVTLNKSAKPIVIDNRPALLHLKLSLGANGIRSLHIDAQ